MVQPEKAARRGNTQNRRKPADFGRLNVSIMGQNTMKLSKAAVVSVLVIFSLVQRTEAIGLPMLETAQPLPQQCSDYLKQNGCPERSHFPDKWRNHSQICCAKDPQTVLHCQEQDINGQTTILVACLSDQTIPPGKLGRLIKNNTAGFLEVDLTKDCAPGTYRTHRINSSFIRYPHCKVKTKEKHAEVVCDGGTISDNFLACQKGFKSDCSPDLKANHNLCPCYRLRCEEGLQPDRSITGHCNDSSIRVIYNCTAPMSSTEAAVSSRTPEESQDSSPVTPPGLTTSSTDTTTTEEQGRSTSVITGIGITVAAVLVIAGLVVAICVWRWYQKRAGKFEPQKISYSACSPSEEVQIEILPDGVVTD